MNTALFLEKMQQYIVGEQGNRLRKGIHTKYRTEASTVPPFFHMKFFLKWGVGLNTAAESDMKIPAHKILFLSQFVFVCS